VRKGTSKTHQLLERPKRIYIRVLPDVSPSSRNMKGIFPTGAVQILVWPIYDAFPVARFYTAILGQYDAPIPVADKQQRKKSNTANAGTYYCSHITVMIMGGALTPRLSGTQGIDLCHVVHSAQPYADEI
jgi:hypothetical protein